MNPAPALKCKYCGRPLTRMVDAEPVRVGMARTGEYRCPIYDRKACDQRAAAAKRDATP